MNSLSWLSLKSLRYFAMSVLAYSQMIPITNYIMQVYQLIASFVRSIDPAQAVPPTDFLTSLSSLIGVVKLHPNRAKNRFQDMLNILSVMLIDQSTFKLQDCFKLYEVIVDLFCRCSLAVRHNSETIGQMLRAGVAVLSKVDAGVTTEWSHPSHLIDNEGNNETDEELKISKEVMNLATRMCQQIGSQILRASFMPIYREYLELSQDWRQKYGAMLIASQMGEEVEHVQEVKSFADSAIKQLQSNHPKVKFAAIELLGQLSFDINPIFQQEYFQSVIPLLIKLLGDQFPRIASHAFASLSNFFYNLDEYWKVENISGDLLNPILHYLKNGTPFMREAALDVVNSLAKIRHCLGENIVFLIQGCGEALHACQMEDSNQLLEQILEALSEIFLFQDKKIVGNYVSQFVESLFSFRQRIDASTFITCWNKLCMEYEAFADLQSTNIVPFILEEAEKEIEDGLTEVSDLILECLCNTFKAFTWRMRPYLQSIFSFGKKILQDGAVESIIRNKSMEMMVSLLLNLRTEEVKQEDIFMDTAISILQFLIEFGDKCITPDGEILLLQGVLDGMKRLIEPLSAALNQTSIMGISDKLLTFQQKIEQEMGCEDEEKEVEIVQVIQQPQESGDEQKDVYVQEQDDDDESDENLQEIIDLIPDVYTSLLKICREGEKESLINVLVPQISFAVSKTEEWKMFGLNLALALVQNCSYHDLSAYWGHLMMMFNGFVEDSSHRLRSLSAYGMGIIFEKTPQELVMEENVISWMQALWKGNQVSSEGDESDKIYANYCKDNFVAALGKLIKNCGPKFPHLFSAEIYRKWLQSLPLKHDQEQSDCQQELLIEILTTSPNLLVNDTNDLKTICQIFASFMVLRCQSKQSVALSRSKECFLRIQGWDIFQRCCQFLWGNLTPSHRNALSKLMSYE